LLPRPAGTAPARLPAARVPAPVARGRVRAPGGRRYRAVPGRARGVQPRRRDDPAPVGEGDHAGRRAGAGTADRLPVRPVVRGREVDHPADAGRRPGDPAHQAAVRHRDQPVGRLRGAVRVRRRRAARRRLAGPPAGRVMTGNMTGNAVHMEWTKLRTVPSTAWSLLALVAVTVTVGALVLWSLDTTHCGTRCDQDLPRLSLAGVYLGQLAVVVVAVLAVTAEYDT